MKKLLAFLLSIVFIFSLVACGTQETNPSEQDTSTTTSENTSQSTEENEKFSYKMVEATSAESDNVLTYVVYTDAHFSEHSGFAVYTKDGVEISKYGNSKNVSSRHETTYVCDECTYDHATTTKYDDLKTHSRLIVIILYFEDEIYNFEDLIVKTTVYDDIEAKTGEEIILKANAKMEDLKLNEKYLHTKSVIKDDAGNWFVCNPNGGSGSSSDGEVYKIITLTTFNKKTAKFEGEFEIVDKNGLSVQVPEEFETFIEINQYGANGINFGLKQVEQSNDFKDEQRELVDSMYLKYTDKDGNITYFFN